MQLLCMTLSRALLLRSGHEARFQFLSKANGYDGAVQANKLAAHINRSNMLHAVFSRVAMVKSASENTAAANVSSVVQQQPALQLNNIELCTVGCNSTGRSVHSSLMLLAYNTMQYPVECE
jgi:hypothetical protein